MDLYHCGKLYQKTGYILEMFQEDFGLPDSFFDECEKHLPDSKTYFSAQKDGFVFHKRCRLFAPEYFSFNHIVQLNPQRIKTDLIPVLRRGEHFDLELAQSL